VQNLSIKLFDLFTITNILLTNSNFDQALILEGKKEEKKM